MGKIVQIMHKILKFINQNNKFKTFASKLGEKLYILAGTFLVMYPISPYTTKYAYYDSGVFLYIGWRILNGEIPYRDIWDHKPPVIYYINALGLAISGNSRWGVWIIEFISLFIAAMIAYKLLKMLFGLYPAMVSSFVWLLSLAFLLADGNYTTEYTLTLQFATLYLFYALKDNPHQNIMLFSIGLMGGLAFLTKQTSIGIWLALGIYFVSIGIKNKEFLTRAKQIFTMFLGVLSIFSIVGGYFLINNALEDLWDAAFRFNIYYSSSSNFPIFQRVLRSLRFFNIKNVGIYQFAILGVILFAFLNVRNIFHKKKIALLSVVLLSFPLDFTFIQLSLYSFSHYFLTILPALTLFSGLTFFIIYKSINEQAQSHVKKYSLIILTLILLMIISFNDYNVNRWKLQGDRLLIEPTIDYIKMHSTSKDTVVVTSHQVMINFHTKRVSPTRYIYPTPLNFEEYRSDEMFREFFDDIILRKPKFIITYDDDKSDEDKIFSLPSINDSIDEKISFIESSYTKVFETEKNEVYEIISD